MAKVSVYVFTSNLRYVWTLERSCLAVIYEDLWQIITATFALCFYVLCRPFRRTKKRTI